MDPLWRLAHCEFGAWSSILYLHIKCKSTVTAPRSISTLLMLGGLTLWSKRRNLFSKAATSLRFWTYVGMRKNEFFVNFLFVLLCSYMYICCIERQFTRSWSWTLKQACVLQSRPVTVGWALPACGFAVLKGHQWSQLNEAVPRTSLSRKPVLLLVYQQQPCVDA